MAFFCFIETWGWGFDKIRNDFLSANLPMPLFESKFGGQQVTIRLFFVSR
ncbi:MAG: hypothetical protein II937_09735 [Bacteroidales bacterium]|nr:hypothetical protein [Bacteroidales bacterium]